MLFTAMFLPEIICIPYRPSRGLPPPYHARARRRSARRKCHRARIIDDIVHAITLLYA